MPQYTRNPVLNESDLAAEPLAQLERWLAEAVDIGMQEPTAMTLATVDANGTPSARIVLFKGIRDGGLTFYTNYESHKGQDLAANPNVALVFWWDKLERSVRIEGRAEKVSEALSREYFYLRPRPSQVGAVTSRQSKVVATREALDARFDTNTKKFEGQDVPFPNYWGGYVVKPTLVEFWQGRHGRLHDRLQYVRSNEKWRVERLEP